MIHTGTPTINSGVYRITSPTGKIYVGQAINLERRKKCYQQLQVKRQPKIYRSLLKYGWENHIWEEYITPKHKLDITEIEFKQQIIDDLGWEKALFCEIYDNGGGPKSQETKDKMSKSGLGVPQPNGFGENISKKLKGRNVTWGHKLGGKDTPRMILRKPVIQEDKNGNFIKQWDSGMEAERIFGKDKYSDNVGACCRGKQKTAYGFIWKYLDI